MPQMSAFYWLLLMFTFLLFYLIFVVFIYHNSTRITSSSEISGSLGLNFNLMF